MFIIDGIVEKLLSILVEHSTDQIKVKDLISKISEIELSCKKEIEIRLKTLTSEFDLKFSKNFVISLLNIIKSKVLSLIKITALALNEKCKYKKTIVKSVQLGTGVVRESGVKYIPAIENPVGPNDLSKAMIISEVNDELIDEDILNKIKSEDEVEKEMNRESTDNLQPATIETKEEQPVEKDLYQLDEDEIVRMLSYKQGRRVKTIKSVLENKLKNIVETMDGKINAMMEVKEEVDPKAKKKWNNINILKDSFRLVKLVK